MPIFPVVIEFIDAHGLEHSAVEGRDYFRFKVCFSPEELPLKTTFRLLGAVHTQNLHKKEEF